MTSPLAGHPGLPRPVRTAAGIVGAVLAGMVAGLAVPAAGPAGPGPGVVVSVLAVLLAGANGFSKAYSP